MMENDIIIIVFVLKRRFSIQFGFLYAMKPSENWIKIYVNLIQLMMHNGNKYNGQKRFNSSSFLVFFYYLFLKLISHCNLHLHFILHTCMKLLHQIKLMCTSSGCICCWLCFGHLSFQIRFDYFSFHRRCSFLYLLFGAFAQQAQSMRESNSIFDGRFLRTSSIVPQTMQFHFKLKKNINIEEKQCQCV